MYYPGIYDRDIDPEFFYPSYISTYIERDVRQIKNIENLNVIYGGDKDLKTSSGNYISWKSIQKIKI